MAKSDRTDKKNKRSEKSSKKTVEASTSSEIETTTTTVKTNVDYTTLEKDQQIIPIETFDWERVIAKDPVLSDVPGGVGNYRRVHLLYLYDDGKVGPILVQPTKKFCFGVKPNNIDKDGKVFINNETGQPQKLTGYTATMPMTSKEPNDAELTEVKFFDDAYTFTDTYVNDNASKLGKSKEARKGRIIVSDVLYTPEDKEGKPIEGKSRTLTVPLNFFHKKKGKIVNDMQTIFYGPGDHPIDPLSMTGYFSIIPTIHLDHIFVGSKNKLQMRIYDATVIPNTQMQRKRMAPVNTTKANENDDTTENGDDGYNSDNEPSNGENGGGYNSPNRNQNPENMMDSDEE